MLLDPPESLTAELIARYDALKKAEANYAARPSVVNLTVKNAAVGALNKTLDKCSIELGQPTQPRPTIAPQEDATLKLLYAAYGMVGAAAGTAASTEPHQLFGEAR